MDRLNSQQRHANMAAIHGKDTKPEMVVRRWLWGHGFRYRLNHPRLPGKPEIVMRKYRTCIFVNGCFWHGHNVSLTPNPSPKGEGSKEFDNSECCKIPKTNREGRRRWSRWYSHSTRYSCSISLRKRKVMTCKTIASGTMRYQRKSP